MTLGQDRQRVAPASPSPEWTMVCWSSSIEQGHVFLPLLSEYNSFDLKIPTPRGRCDANASVTSSAMDDEVSRGARPNNGAEQSTRPAR